MGSNLQNGRKCTISVSGESTESDCDKMFAQGCSVQMDEIVAQEQRRGTRCRIILELRLGFKMISRLWDKMHLQPSCDPNLFSIVDPGWQNALLWTVLGSLEETYMPGQCCKETGSGRLSVHKIFQWIGLETMDHLDFKCYFYFFSSSLVLRQKWWQW